MTGIENITGRIQADAQAEIDRIDADARAQADKITAAYAARTERECADILERGAKSAAERGDRLVSAAQMEARQMNLAAKQEVLDKAFEAAKQKLLALPQDQYIALLADLAVQASSTGREQLIFSPADRARVGKAVVMAANEKLAKAVAPQLPDEVTDTRAGAILNKVVTGASAVLNGTAMLTLSEETRPMEGGFILSSGYTEVNCTFGTLIRLQRDTLAAEVAKVLFD